jgi:hypothetical protein
MDEVWLSFLKQPAEVVESERLNPPRLLPAFSEIVHWDLNATRAFAFSALRSRRIARRV